MFALVCRRLLPALALIAGITACSGGIGSTSSPLPTAATQTTIPGPIPAVGIRSLGLDTRIRPRREVEPNLRDQHRGLRC
jgi:hypothetical protein